MATQKLKNLEEGLEGVVRVTIEAIGRPPNKKNLQTLLQSTAFPQPAGQNVCTRVSLQPALSANTTVGTKDRSTAFQASAKSFRVREQKKRKQRVTARKRQKTGETQREKESQPKRKKERKKQREKDKKETKNKRPRK